MLKNKRKIEPYQSKLKNRIDKNSEKRSLLKETEKEITDKSKV